MRIKLFHLGVVFGALLAAALTALDILFPTKMSTSISDLIKRDSDHPAAGSVLQRNSDSMVQVIFAAPSIDAVLAAMEQWTNRLDRAIFSDHTSSFDFEAVLEFYRANRGGLVSAELLQKTDEDIVKNRVRSLYSSPTSGLFSFTDDPFGLLDSFVRSLPSSYGAWRMNGGVLTAESDGMGYALINLRLAEGYAGDIGRLPAAVDHLFELNRSLSSDGNVKIYLCGAPIHSAVMARRTKTEINYLSVVSLVFVLAVAWFALRRWQRILFVFLTVLTAALAGYSALNFCFREFHLLACVFATTVIGLVVDYAFHRCLARESWREICRSMTLSFVTTELSFAPLWFSGVEILEQMALFVGVGLAAAFGFIAVYGRFVGQSETEMSVGGVKTTKRLCAILVGVALILVVYGGRKIVFATSAADLYCPSGELMEAERIRSQISGANGGEALTIVCGASIEEILENEEQLDIPSSIVCASRFFPSLKMRAVAYERMRTLFDAGTNKLVSVLGCEAPEFPSAPRSWDECLPDAMRLFFMTDNDGNVFSMIPAAVDIPKDDPRYWTYSPRREINKFFSDMTAVTLRLLGVTLTVLIVLLAVVYRRGCWRIIIPSLTGIVAAFACAALFGSSITLFHLLAAFMLAGMGVDYAIFMNGHGKAALKPVVCSMLTSLVGFGSLYFVSFPLVSSIGLVMAVGLPVSFATAVILCADEKKADDGAEIAASPLGLEILWCMYRLFGCRMLRLGTRAVTLVIWCFSAKARANAKTFTRLCNFTTGLADKLAAMSGGADAPEVIAHDDEDTKKFLSFVNDGKGVLVISSHLGMIEVLPALGGCPVKFHAFMNISRTGAFNAFYQRHLARSDVELHAAESFGMGEMFALYDWLDEGAVVLMAGDRGYGRTFEAELLGRKVRLPAGVFKIAGLCEHPVFAVVVLRKDDGRYEVKAKEIKNTDEAAAEYLAFISGLLAKNRNQYYNWDF